MVKKFFLLMVIVALMILSFIAGRFIPRQLPEVTREPCTGYTVLSRSKVISCSGDTINYDWHKDNKKYQIY